MWGTIGRETLGTGQQESDSTQSCVYHWCDCEPWLPNLTQHQDYMYNSKYDGYTWHGYPKSLPYVWFSCIEYALKMGVILQTCLFESLVWLKGGYEVKHH